MKSITKRQQLLHLFGGLLMGASLTVQPARAEDAPPAPPKGESRALAAGRTETREIAPKEQHLYRVRLERGDFMGLEVEQKGVDVVVRLFDPAGKLLFEVDSPNGATGTEFLAHLARGSGDYLVEVAGLEESPAGSYEIDLYEKLSTDERVGWRQPLVSPRLISLRDRLAANDGAALGQFWDEMRERTTPLIEPLPDDPERVLVTFLWRAEPGTRNVYVLTDIERALEGCRMQRLGDTDVFYRSYRIRSDARMAYTMSPDDAEIPMQEVDWNDPRQAERRSATSRPDPLNPHRFPEEPGLPDIYLTSILELPKAPPQVWSTPRPGVPSGELSREIFRSKILGNARLVQVYTPPGYTPEGEPYDLLVLFGGRSYTVEIPTPVILDNLLAEKRIRPAVAVFVANPGLAARDVELSCHPPFLDLLVDELLPWVRGRYHVTTDPRRTTAVGFSLGGLTAVYAAFKKPEVFGNALSQSGSFFWKPADDPEHEWLTRQIAASPRVQARVYLEAGDLENGPKTGGPSLLIANRHLRDVLTARGYEVIYRQYSGDHQSVNWRGTLADGLQALLGPGR